MTWLGGWRPALRMARRDARRARWRSLLVVVMIAVPVLGVTAADVLIRTQDLSGSEGLDRRIGTADARLQPLAGRVVQDVDPGDLVFTRGRLDDRADLTDIARVLGGDLPAITIDQGYAEVATEAGVAGVETTVVDLTDPLAAGLFGLTDGRLPSSPDEVVISQGLADRGYGVGDRLRLADGPEVAVVGVGESASYRGTKELWGADPDLAVESDGQPPGWLVGGGEVTWEQVRALNEVGVSAVSRAAIADPPPESELAPQVQEFHAAAGTDPADLAVVLLVVVMALLEVVLLAGPAFAVGARRQARALALVSASGGTPAQSRRVVLAQAVVLGGVGAGVGVVLGLATAWATAPLVQRFSVTRFGPYDVPWAHLPAIAGLGLVSALLAAVVPAWLASRQDVVAVLGGRRGDRAPSRRSPLVGLVLLGGGVALAAYGARASENGEYLIAGSTVLAVLGMVLLVPLVVAGLARVSRRLPLPLRYAARDAARHRTRTAPAVAAVAATVVGVVALGIGQASDAAQSEAEYVPLLPEGTASVQAWGVGEGTWAELRSAVDRTLPADRVHELTGVPEQVDRGWRGVRVTVDGAAPFPAYGYATGSQVLVGDAATLALLEGVVSPTDLDRAATALDAGRAVVPTDEERPDGPARVAVALHPARGEVVREVPATDVAATFVRVGEPQAPVAMLVPPAVADRLALPTETVALGVDGPVTAEQEADLTEAVAAVTTDASFYVERGFQAEDETVVILLVLAGLGAVLMLGGTLTATGLSLADARPDLATLAAVGATPRTRRAVAASYALVIGLVGAVLGALVGFVPGVAVSYPLTSAAWYGDRAPTHYLDVPWLLVGSVVVVLPLLTALLVGLTSRGRLPTTARLT